MIDVKFDDVKGLHEVKDELKEVIDYLKNPEKYKRLGARLPKGVLLVGVSFFFVLNNLKILNQLIFFFKASWNWKDSFS